MPFLIETSSLEDCAQLCTTLKLNFIELNMNFPQCQLHNLSISKLNKIKSDYNLYFSIHLDENLNVCDFNHAVKNAYLKTVIDTISLAKEIKIPIINMHLAKGIYITLPEKKVFLFEEYQKEYLSNLQTFKELCEQAIDTSGIKIAIENTDGFMEYEKSAIEMLLESECFGLTLDIGHSHVVNDMDMEFYERHIDKLIHMHAHDAKGSKNHLAFGDGEINLQHRLKLAQTSDIRVVLETKTIDALKKTVSFLKNQSFL